MNPEPGLVALHADGTFDLVTEVLGDHVRFHLGQDVRPVAAGDTYRNITPRCGRADTIERGDFLIVGGMLVRVAAMGTGIWLALRGPRTLGSPDVSLTIAPDLFLEHLR